MGQTPNDPPAPSHGAYQDILGQTPNYPLVTPVTTLQAPLPFQNQIGRYQAELDAFEEVWRNHHGSIGFRDPSNCRYRSGFREVVSRPSEFDRHINSLIQTRQRSTRPKRQLRRLRQRSVRSREKKKHASRSFETLSMNCDPESAAQKLITNGEKMI